MMITTESATMWMAVTCSRTHKYAAGIGLKTWRFFKKARDFFCERYRSISEDLANKHHPGASFKKSKQKIKADALVCEASQTNKSLIFSTVRALKCLVERIPTLLPAGRSLIGWCAEVDRYVWRPSRS